MGVMNVQPQTGRRVSSGWSHSCHDMRRYYKKSFSVLSSPNFTKSLDSTRKSLAAKATSVDTETQPDLETEFDYGISCSQGPRDGMEDELCIIPQYEDALYAAVFDGHGGDAVALWLNENLQDFVKPALKQSSNYQAAMEAAFKAADSEVLEYLKQRTAGGDPVTGAGATASVIIARNNEIISANIGDSSAILMRKGQQLMLTQPHRVYGKSQLARDEIKRVVDAGGWVSRDGRVCDVLAVSRAFGDWEFKGEGLQTLLAEGIVEEWWDSEFAASVEFTADPVICSPSVSHTAISAEAGDEFLVVATDGLWDFYPQNEAMKYAREALKSGARAQEVSDSLVEKALKRYTSDNVAVIVIKFPWGIGKAVPYSKSGKKFLGIF